MTKLNWDRVNMENLIARRNSEFLSREGGDEREKIQRPSSYRKFRKYVSKRVGSRLHQSQQGHAACTYCGNLIPVRSMDKHLKKKHSLWQRIVDVFRPKQKSSDSTPIDGLAARPYATESVPKKPKKKKKKLKNAAESGMISSNQEKRNYATIRNKKLKRPERIVDVMYSPENTWLANEVSEALDKNLVRVRTIEVRREGKRDSFGRVEWYLKAHGTDEVVDRLQLGIDRFGFNTRRVEDSHTSRLIGVISLCGPPTSSSGRRHPRKRRPFKTG
ncbi:MAG: hypothetical protein IPL32_17260 [Chloracidobacterium sp.]|nr:hypothetical protein [Chloracidobacterium sp.]